MTTQELRKYGGIHILIQRIELVTEHNDLLLCLLANLVTELVPYGVEQHGRVHHVHPITMNSSLLVENCREIGLQVFYYPT